MAGGGGGSGGMAGPVGGRGGTLFVTLQAVVRDLTFRLHRLRGSNGHASFYSNICSKIATLFVLP